MSSYPEGVTEGQGVPVITDKDQRYAFSFLCIPCILIQMIYAHTHAHTTLTYTLTHIHKCLSQNRKLFPFLVVEEREELIALWLIRFFLEKNTEHIRIRDGQADP